ncbi:MAG: hypothetical protein IPP83_18930 [Flavobacteriales bacterium]|nr:hypothetical protein [Flavobacteriales bacterium]
MNKPNEDRMSMIYALLQVLMKHAAVWTGLVPFKNAKDELDANLASLENATQTQETSLKGVALDKRLKKEAMIKKAHEVAEGAYAYAEDKGNVIMRDAVDYSRSDLNKVRDAVVAQTCQGIHDVANGVIADLGAYGLDAADLTTLQTAIDSYVATVGSPRAALTVRKGATAEINALVKDSMKILTKRMDKLMPEFETSAPAFHQEYFDARIIVNSGTDKKDVAEAA